jgi:hypothetical protein
VASVAADFTLRAQALLPGTLTPATQRLIQRQIDDNIRRLC